MITQRFEALMAEQAKAMTEQAKAIVEERKQKSQSQVKLVEAISEVMGEARQQRQEVTSGPTG